MRLINCRTHELVEFMGKAPPYVILSHTWEDEEVTFQDMNVAGGLAIYQKKGFGKIRETCVIALSQGYTWAWVDTCCIDKTSSAELSEAINSMFMWYQKSAVCYTYLSDYEVQKESDTLSSNAETAENRHKSLIFEESLAGCRWFTRGWTLQELIAPATMEIYDKNWRFISTKHNIKKELSHITSIDEDILTGDASLENVLVGRKMSWAATRQTTRAEDRAYSLLGIFDVNMPLLYGEGEKAFLRLQKKILKASTDLSIFAWISDEDVDSRARYCSIFATDPSQFRNCKSLVPPGRTEARLGFLGRQFDVTAQGLKTAGFLRGFGGHYLLPLDCAPDDGDLTGGDRHLCVTLRQYGSNLFVRAELRELLLLPLSAMPRVSIASPQFIAHHNTKLLPKTVIRSWQNSILIDLDNTMQAKYVPLQNWDVLNGRLFSDGYRDFWGCCRLSPLSYTAEAVDTSLDNSQYVYIVCGRDGSMLTENSEEPNPFFCSVLSHSEMVQFNLFYPPVQTLRQVLVKMGYPSSIGVPDQDRRQRTRMSIKGQITQVKVDEEVVLVYNINVAVEAENL